MSPLNRGPLMGPRIPPAGMRPPPMPRYGRAPPPPPGMVRGMPPPPMNPMFGLRGRPIPPPPPRPGPMMSRPGGPPGPPIFGHRNRLLPPMPPPMPPMALRGPMGPRGPLIRPGPRGILPPHALPHMRPRFPPNHINGKGKANTTKKANKLEELELKKPWMTDEIRNEIQKKNKLYAKAKKNKDAKEWEEFKDLRNKVTRMIRDAKNEFLQKNPEQVAQKTAEKSTVENENVQKTENATEQTEQTELNEENKPSSEQVSLYENDEEIPEVTDEDVAEFFTMGSEDEGPMNPYCENCDRDFDTEEKLQKHIQEHETCKIDGCTFTAHSKIVNVHISMQHSSGLYERMKNVMSPDDIAKWRAERKRRYPTAATIKLQEDARVEKQRRGEVIENEVESRKVQNPHKKEQRKIRKRKRSKPVQSVTVAEFVDRIEYRGLLPFAGTGSLFANEKLDDSLVEIAEGDKIVETQVKESKIVLSDEEITIPEVEQFIAAEPETTMSANAVVSISEKLSLVADYGSESDEDEKPTEVPIKKLKVVDEQAFKQPDLSLELIAATKIIKTPNDIKLSPSSARNVNKSVVNKKKIYENEVKNNKQNRRNNYQYSNGRLRLLNRLLARSMQHERNAIYQCITFIANNNFFDRQSY